VPNVVRLDVCLKKIPPY